MSYVYLGLSIYFWFAAFFQTSHLVLRRVEGITFLVPHSQGSSIDNRTMYFGKIGVLNFFITHGFP